MTTNLKIAFRALQKNGIYTAINVFGLAIGLAAALLIYRMVSYELSFNKNFRNYDRIVRVATEEKDDAGNAEKSACIPIPAGVAMKTQIPQFEQVSAIREMWANLTIANPQGGAPLKKFGMNTPEVAFFIEPKFFQIFDFQWLAGDPATALNDVHTIVLTKTWAEKCFDDWKNAVGKTVLLDNLVACEVRGVVEDLPSNCDLPLVYMVSYPTLLAHTDLWFFDKDEWGACSSNNQIFALLRDLAQTAEANAAVGKIGEKEYTAAGTNNRKNHWLQPLADLHFQEGIGTSGGHQTPRSRLWTLSLVGVLILAMACFNFINLATARASLRAREVGVRKTLGSSRGELVRQFLTETGLIVACAVALAAVLAATASPLLQYISEVPTTLPFVSTPQFWLFLFGVGAVVTLLAGIYPAFALSSFQPVQAMRSDVHRRTLGGISLRQILVVAQFVIAQGLIFAAVVIIRQLDFIENKDLGFSKDLVYSFGMNTDSLSLLRQQVLKTKLQQIPEVAEVSLSSDQPLSGNTWSTNFRLTKMSEDALFNLNLKFTDADYQKTYGIRLLAGRWLEPSDTLRDAVLNLTCVKKLGYANPQEILGEKIQLGGGRRKMTIVGVAEDFHSHSFHAEHAPLLLTTRKIFYSEVGVKFRSKNLKGTVAQIEQVYNEVLPEQVISGRFLDERIAMMYMAEQKFSATCKGFGLLAILISCLGLLGLATHAAEQRKKEIGVRKVLGATVGGIVGLLARDFLKLVAVAIVLASPAAYFLMQKWLADYVFRIEIQSWMFAAAAAVLVGIAFLTVSFQSAKAAAANPVQSLRSE